jgi:hypothetical protein
MCKPSQSIHGSDLLPGLHDRRIPGFTGPCPHPAQARLALRPPQLTRRERRRVRRPIHARRTTPGAGVLSPRHLVGAHLVHDDDVPRTQRRTQDLRYKRAKPLAIGRAIPRPQGVEPGQAQGSQQGHGRPLMLGDTPHGAGARWRSSLQARQGQVNAGFSAKLHPLTGDLRQLCPLGQARRLDAWGSACRGVARLVVRRQPSRCQSRPMVATRTRVWHAGASCAHNSASVRSGRCAMSGRTRSWTGGLRGARFPPARGRASGVPVSRCRRTRWRPVAGLTPNNAAPWRGESAWFS